MHKYIIPGLCKSFCQFLWLKKQIIFKEISFFVDSKDWPSASTYFDHLSGKLWIPHQKNCLSFVANHLLSHFPTSSKLLNCCSGSAYPIDDSQMLPDQRIIAGAKGCPIQAISRCLLLVLMCDMGQCRVTKSLCHVFLAHSSRFSINAWLKLIISWL